MGRSGRSCGDLVTDSATPTNDFAAAQDRMRHVPEPVKPDAPLPAGDAGAEYPLNEQHLEDFQVGGVERSLPPTEQLAQLVSYMENSYPVPSSTDAEAIDRYLAALPDRLTHAAMLMLGSGLDHTMPGVAYGMDAETSELPELGARLFAPAGDTTPTGQWAVAVHPEGFGPRAVEHYWRPLIAAVAQLTGTTILDLDAPTTEAIDAALGYIAQQSPTATAILTARAVEQHSATLIDATPLTHPTPNHSSAGIAENQAGIIATPEEFRRITASVAETLRNS